MNLKKPSENRFYLIWTLLSAYWKGSEKRSAWILLIGIIILSSMEVHSLVKINYWYSSVYHSFEKVDWETFVNALLKFPFLVFYLLFCALGMYYLSAQLTLRWRRWMTFHFLNKWLNKNAFYALSLSEKELDNPDQRIAQDVRSVCSETLNLLIVLYKSFITILSFGFILFHVYDAFEYHIGSIHIYIPGAMMWAAILFACLSSGFIWKVGYALIGLDVVQEKKEAHFRYGLMRLKERAPEAAMMFQPQQEEQVSAHTFSAVIQNFYQILRRQMILNVWINIMMNTSNILPLLIAAPKFFMGSLSLGALMQVVHAFQKVENAMSFIVNKFTDIASWRASLDRLVEFNKRILYATSFSSIETTSPKILSLENVALFKPDGTPLLQDVTFQVHPSQWVHIQGPSGIGKSTLIQTIAGNWPFAKGTIKKPKGRWMYGSQKPYFPFVPLTDILENRTKYLVKDTKETLFFLKMNQTRAAKPKNSDKLNELFTALDLTHLLPSLDKTFDVHNTLSLGEQQRLSFIRIIIAQPEWVVLDEPTTSLDATLANRAYALLKEKCPKASVILISHEQKRVVDQTINLFQFSRALDIKHAPKLNI